MDHPEVQRLKSALAAGQSAAFADLYDLVGDKMFRVAFRISGHRMDAEDAVQEVFASLVKSRHKLKHVENINAYVFSCLRRAVARISQRRASEQAALRSQAADLIQRQSNSTTNRLSDMHDRLADAVGQLPLEQRIVVALKTEAQMTFRDIATVLRISENTAASRYRYALERIRKLTDSTDAK